MTDQREDAAMAFLDTMSSSSGWADVGPHLTCSEADAAVAMLKAWDYPTSAEALAEAHAASDEEGDAHYAQ